MNQAGRSPLHPPPSLTRLLGMEVEGQAASRLLKWTHWPIWHIWRGWRGIWNESADHPQLSTTTTTTNATHTKSQSTDVCVCLYGSIQLTLKCVFVSTHFVVSTSLMNPAGIPFIAAFRNIRLDPLKWLGVATSHTHYEEAAVWQMHEEQVIWSKNVIIPLLYVLLKSNSIVHLDRSFDTVRVFAAGHSSQVQESRDRWSGDFICQEQTAKTQANRQKWQTQNTIKNTTISFTNISPIGYRQCPGWQKQTAAIQ